MTTMRILIAEDDFTCRCQLHEVLKPLGTVELAVNGVEALQAMKQALNAGNPYQLICLDILMPEMDGQAALGEIRSLEKSHGIISTKGAKIFMVTSKDDFASVRDAFYDLCDGYILKPLDIEELYQKLGESGLPVPIN